MFSAVHVSAVISKSERQTGKEMFGSSVIERVISRTNVDADTLGKNMNCYSGVTLSVGRDKVKERGRSNEAIKQSKNEELWERRRQRSTTEVKTRSIESVNTIAIMYAISTADTFD